MAINKLSSAKLLIVTIGLIMGAFVMLSMTFPEEESNDTTTVSSGPRRSHYHEDDSCGSVNTDHGAKDYAKAIAITTGGGTVTISSPSGGGMVTTQNGKQGVTSLGSNDGDQAVVEWNCNTEVTKSTQTSAEAHTRIIKFEAAADDNHRFVGWSTSKDAKDVVATANPYEEEMSIDDWDKNNGKHEESEKAVTLTYYAIFAEKVEVSYIFMAAEGGSYTYDCQDQNGTISISTTGLTTGKEITTRNTVTLVASAYDEYEFFGWYTLDASSEENYFATSATANIAFDAGATIYAKFIRKGSAIFKVGDAQYYDLNKANAVANSSTDKTIILVKDGTLYPLEYGGNYTISAGVTLVVPCEATETVSITGDPNVVTSTTAPEAFRTLKFAQDANLIVYGTLAVAGSICSGSGGSNSSYTTGPCGVIDMSKGGNIEVCSGGKLYCWGFIKGPDYENYEKGKAYDIRSVGSITAQSGAEVWEPFVAGDYRGGSVTTTITGKASTYHFFPFQNYYLQNIEVPTAYNSGSNLKCYVNVTALSKQWNATGTIIGTENALFSLSEGLICKWYDPTTDCVNYGLQGSASLSSLSIKVAGESIESSDYYLPITSNMHISVESGSKISLNSDITMQPGSIMHIKENGEVTLNSQLNLFDQADWGEYVCGGYFKPIRIITKRNQLRGSDVKSKTNMEDGKIIIDGKLVVSSEVKLYTTSSGANITSEHGGAITYEGVPSKETKITNYIGTSAKNLTTDEQTITPAKLRNADTYAKSNPYLETAGVPKGTTINYRNGHWGWLTEWIDTDGNTVLKQVIAIVKQGSEGYTYVGTIPSDREWDFWKEVLDEENQEVRYIAQFKEKDAVGPLLDIVDWKTTETDDGKTTVMTVNFNGVAASIWPLTIKVGDADEKEYAKGDRNTDRKWDIPYSGDPNTDLKIKVTDKEGNIYSQHSYVIPQVYDADAPLDNVRSDGHSIIFVRKGKLTVEEDAKVGAVYVAPGAELEIRSATLTVDSLMLRTTPWEAAILTNKGMISAGKAYYTRIVSDMVYYQFALPLGSNIADVRLSNYANFPYERTWLLKWYDEKSRADKGVGSGSNWVQLNNGDAIVATTGYELFSGSAYYREIYFPVTLPASGQPSTEVKVSHTDGKAGAAHSGWNALCSPLLGKYTQEFAEPSSAIKVSRLTESGNYYQCIPEVIYPAVPFYYQAPKDSRLDFSGKELILKAPQRAWNTSVSEQWLRLTIGDQVGTAFDETNIFVHPEKFSADYEPGYDVAKQSLTASTAALYSVWPCGALAFAAIPDSVAADRIPLTVGAGKAGEYTFSLQDNDYLERIDHVFLYDTQTGAVTDLLGSDYTTAIPQGTTAGRFYIRCVFAPVSDTATGLPTFPEDLQTDHVQKFLYNNRVYILRNGVLYDLTGRQCQIQ